MGINKGNNIGINIGNNIMGLNIGNKTIGINIGIDIGNNAEV